jgi:hypothetical protein
MRPETIFVPAIRVTRWGELQKWYKVLGYFTHGTSNVLIFYKKTGLGYILGDFFTNSSGHPASKKNYGTLNTKKDFLPLATSFSITRLKLEASSTCKCLHPLS